MRARYALTIAVLCVAALAVAREQRAPWPSEYFNPKPPANNAGDFDYYALVLSWSPTHCIASESDRDEMQCDRRDGQRYGFVVHGLWPQFEKGYPERCRTAWRPFVPEDVIASMRDIMPSRNLVIHEYKAHGTCSGLQPAPYFALARRAFAVIHIPDRYQNPFEPQYVSAHELEGDLLRANPQLRPEMIAISCGGPGNRLTDVRICLTKNGGPRPCGKNENQMRLCRADQVLLPPVRSTKRLDTGLNPKAMEDKPLPRPRLIESPNSQ
jgi:ribonuclease T2